MMSSLFNAYSSREEMWAFFEVKNNKLLFLFFSQAWPKFISAHLTLVRTSGFQYTFISEMWDARQLKKGGGSDRRGGRRGEASRRERREDVKKEGGFQAQQCVNGSQAWQIGLNFPPV